MTWKKRLTALLLAMAMLLALAACGSSSDDSTTTSDSDSSSAEETAEAEETETEEEEEAAEETSSDETESAAEESSTSTDENAITDLVDYKLTSAEMSTFLIQYSQSSNDLNVLTNMYDGLLTNDTEGNLIANLAETWGTDDGGLTWTFNLRTDAVWADYNGEYKADLTSTDFVTGAEWILNAYKNEAANSSMLTDTIAGAQEYYDYTASLTKEEALALDISVFTDMVGIETPDDYTIIYHCSSETPYFDTLGAYNCLYPLPAGLIEEVGVENMTGIDNTTTWYSGPYILTEYIYQNEKVLEPNPLWWGAEENTRFNSVTIKMVESLDVAYQLYQTGEIDHVTLSESNLSIIYSDPDNEYYDYLVETRLEKFSYHMDWNFSKLDEDGNPDENWNKAVANEAFRLSWYYGLDLTTYWQRTNAINPLSLENNAYTMRNLCFTSDGTDYVDLVLENLGLDPDYDGDTPQRVDEDLFTQYKEQAIEELTELGVTFPIEVDYYISASDQTELDTANVLQQIFSDCLGDEYVVLNIKTYVSSIRQEVYIPQLESIGLIRWGADYGDPQNFLAQEIYGDENAYFTNLIGNVDDLYDATEDYRQDLIASLEEYTELVYAANEITDDMDERYEAYAVAEAYLISHCLSLPTSYSSSWQLTKINDYSNIYGIYGIQPPRYINWETNVNGYTTEEYEAFAAAAG